MDIFVLAWGDWFECGVAVFYFDFCCILGSVAHSCLNHRDTKARGFLSVKLLFVYGFVCLWFWQGNTSIQRYSIGLNTINN